MPDQRIEKRRFAAFELTDTRHLESPFGNPLCDAAGRGSYVLCSELVRQLG
jgi:hypothetical protein